LECDLNVSIQTGTTVAAWLDQSGLGNDMVASGNPQWGTVLTPSGLPAVSFDGDGDKVERTGALGGLPSGNANRTIIMVAKYKGSTAWAGVSYGTGANNQAFGLNVKHPTGELDLQGWGGGNDLISTTPGIGAGWLVQAGVLGNGIATLYKDGAQIAQWAHTYATVLSKMVIGAEIANLGFVNVDVAAVLIYNRALTAGELASVQSFLQTKYFQTGVPNTAPVVTITAPANGASFANGTAITFTGSAIDALQGNLSAGLAWSSSINGAIGTGASISVSSLSPGTHTITASRTDAGGLTGTATITVTVVAAAPPVTTNLVLHLESTQGVSTSGTKVNSWTDLSSRANTVSSVGNPQLVPTRTPSGKPAITFNGTTDALQRVHSSSPLNGFPTVNANRTIFIVAKYNNASTDAGVSYGTASSNRAFGLVVAPTTGQLRLQGWGSSNELTSTTAGSGAGWLVQSAVLSSGTATLFKNGTQIAQWAHTYNTSLTRLAIAARLSSGFVNMEVAAVLIYDRALTATERASVETYLRTKYL
ncbi:MAG: LamG-like jellyroll fold domain-containing protein, partial [Chthoniobacteraceae bacterium]